MRLYVRRTAPNALKVLVFAAEREITLDIVDVDALSLKEFRCISPLGIVPALVTRNGSVLTESLTICRYLDEVSPGELLFGHSAEERATIGMWERRSELMLLNPAIDYIHHTLPEFTQVTRQFPAWARQDALSAAERLLPLMEAQLLRNRYLAGNRFSAADITAYFGCSALKEAYRKRLTAGLAEFRIVYLRGSFELLSQRAGERKHRFMPASLLKSQFEALEPPADAIEIDVAQPVEGCVAQIRSQLGR